VSGGNLLGAKNLPDNFNRQFVLRGADMTNYGNIGKKNEWFFLRINNLILFQLHKETLMNACVRRKRVPTRDTNLGPPNNRRWRFIPTSWALILTLFAGSVVPSWATTEDSEITVHQNNSVSILFDNSTIQSPDGELVFDEIDLGGCTVEGRDGTIYHDPDCVEDTFGKRTRSAILIGIGFTGIIPIIAGTIGIIGGFLACLFSCPHPSPPPPNLPPTVELVTPQIANTFSTPQDVKLEWKGSDPEGDSITYSVFLGTERLDHCENLSNPTCTIPKDELEFGKSYFWIVEAKDSHENAQKGAPWGFSIRGNNPPHRANNPTPADDAENIDYASNVDLGWEGDGDPDGDDVNYDVYVSDVKSKLISLNNDDLICSGVSNALSCIPEDNGFDDIKGGNSYFWRVVANDEHGSSTKGFFWEFATQSPAEAAFQVNFAKGIAPFTIKFEDTSNGNVKSYLWDFGVPNEDATGNQTSSDQNPSFTYNNPGPYTVKLTVIDGSDNESSAEMNITVDALVSVPVTVRPGADTMNLDWSAESINTYIPDPANTFFEFWRTTEGTEDWQQVSDSVNYMDPSISVNQYFDKNTVEPLMVKDQKYCYYFKVLKVKEDGDANLLTQSEEVCETFGAVRLFIDNVASAGPGNEVVIPVKIANAQDLQIANGNLSIAFDKNVISPVDMTVVLSPLLTDEFGDALYEFGVPSVEEDGNNATVTFPFDGNLDEKLFGGQENFFWIKSTVSGNNNDETGLNWDKNPDKSFMKDVISTDIALSFGNANFTVRKGNRLRDSKSVLVADGSFTVDASGRLGDPNLNAVVDPDDVKQVLRYIVDKETNPLNEKQFAAADANGNGKIDVNDAAMISYYSFKGEWPSSSSESAQDDSPMVIKLGDMSGESGVETETTLNVENLSNFTGGKFVFSYDPTVVEGITDIKRTLFTKRFSVFFHDNGEGKVRIVMASREPINGNGELVSVKLRLKSKTTLRKRTRDGASVGKRSASLVLAQTQLYDPAGRNFVTSRLQRTVERKNAEVVRTDVVEEVNDDTSTGGNSTPNNGNTGSKLPKVTGQILDKAGDPIVGITVQIGDQTTITDETGYWEIADLAKGGYTVTASKEGYTFVPQNFTLEDDDVVINHKTSVDSKNDAAELRFTSGYILDDNNKPIAGVTVQMGDKTVVTDETGFWSIDGVTDGIHTVTATKDGHWFAPKKLAIIDADVIVEMGSNGPYSVGGAIVDELGKPIVDVEVKIGDEKTVTTDLGYWEINGLREGDDYVAIASKEGYTFAPIDFALGNEEFRQEVPIEPISDIKVSIVANSRTVKQDDNITYTITVINGGTETATGVVLTDELPEGTSLVSIRTLDGGECDVDTITCTLPDLTTGNLARVELVVNNTQTNTLLNTATVTSNEYPTDVDKEWTRVIPHLSVSITDTPDPIAMSPADVERTLHYTLTVELSPNAPTAATGVELVTTLPSSVELQSVSSDYGMCDTSNMPTLICSLTDLSVNSPDDMSKVTVKMDVALEDAGLLVLTSEAKISANEYPAHIDRERTQVFVPPDYKVEMAVVVDVTGSMQEEINGVKKAMLDFINELDQSTFPLSALVTFRDDVTFKAVTSDGMVLTNAIKGIKVSGGGTCQEASVEALNKAVDHVEDGGTILFVTDASPYDDADVDALTERLRNKGIRLNAIITGNCTQKDSWNELSSAE
jgi:uncharacterized repeat protein (TIGR01451 family)